ncbi:MAG TPA: FKBP-type peptidyl-prolyl cis-trans isomerase [Mariniphaga sp.]|nr:FKBP-type peptidyl-prolyl cis-trans isomerase [Mariniphaga sp.]
MKKMIDVLKKIGLMALLAGVLVSCLDEDEPHVYTSEEEVENRNKYLDALIEDGQDIDTLDNELYYVVREEGEGRNIQLLDSLSIGYAGYLIDGRLFDASNKYSFVFEEDMFIDGWHKALPLMNEGAKFEFIIPSELAYGSAGYGPIPPYQTLLFVIEVLENHSVEE